MAPSYLGLNVLICPREYVEQRVELSVVWDAHVACKAPETIAQVKKPEAPINNKD